MPKLCCIVWNGGLLEKQIDVHSFWHSRMETFTRSRPNDEMFSGDFSLKSWIKDSIPNAITEVIDATSLMQEIDNVSNKLQCASMTLELGLNCCNEFPDERISMQDVVV